MGEARNGATDMIDKIARLPGLQKTCVLFICSDCAYVPANLSAPPSSGHRQKIGLFP
jgi:hypothetical protein